MDILPHRRHRLTVYGGTFAPPHIGHVHAALACLEACAPDTLLIMPAAIPPHKRIDAGDDPHIRLRMTRAAFEGLDPRIRVSSYEIDRGGASYTWQTLTHFRETTDSELSFLCGTDMLLSLDRWRCPERIFALSEIACVMRVGDTHSYEEVQKKSEEYRRVYDARVRLISAPPLEMASSDIRTLVRSGESIDAYVPSAVAEIIAQAGLYRE